MLGGGGALRRGLRRCPQSISTRPRTSQQNSTPNNPNLSAGALRWRGTATEPIEQRRRSILTHALQRVHDEGWTDDAVASGTLDAGLPPAYIGHASSATSSFGSADLVYFFMEQCNAELREKLTELSERRDGDPSEETSGRTVAARLNQALRIRLSMAVPYVNSNRWHEGMAIGALPQNAVGTARQLDDMADAVFRYAVGNGSSPDPTQRAAVVAAYASAELHLLSEGNDAGGTAVSLSGQQYHRTWSFLEDRCNDLAGFLADGGKMAALSGLSLPSSNQVAAASAVAASLAGAALSLAAPAVAATAGHALPQAASAVMTPLQSVVASLNLVPVLAEGTARTGTKPSDYMASTDSTTATNSSTSIDDDIDSLPPFDANEEIFPSKP